MIKFFLFLLLIANVGTDIPIAEASNKKVCFEINGKKECLGSAKKTTENTKPENPRYLCKRGKTCLLIYVAPWCANCKAQTPNYLRLLRKYRGNRKIEIKLVIGQELKPRNNRKMAKDFPVNGSSIDANSSIWKMFHIAEVPFYSLETPSKTIEVGEGAYNKILETAGIPRIEGKAFGKVER